MQKGVFASLLNSLNASSAWLALQNAKIAKDAKETVQECVSEFISFITSEASDKCQMEKRKVSQHYVSF